MPGVPPWTRGVKGKSFFAPPPSQAALPYFPDRCDRSIGARRGQVAGTASRGGGGGGAPARGKPEADLRQTPSERRVSSRLDLNVSAFRLGRAPPVARRCRRRSPAAPPVPGELADRGASPEGNPRLGGARAGGAG